MFARILLLQQLTTPPRVECRQHYMSIQHILSFLVKKIKSWDYRFTMLQLLSFTKWISSNFQSSSTTFEHKLLTKEGMVSANGWTHPSPMTIICSFLKKKRHLKCYHSDIKYHMILNNMFIVVSSLYIGPHFKSCMKLLGSALFTCHTLREFKDLK